MGKNTPTNKAPDAIAGKTQTLEIGRLIMIDIYKKNKPAST